MKPSTHSNTWYVSPKLIRVVRRVAAACRVVCLKSQQVAGDSGTICNGNGSVCGYRHWLTGNELRGRRETALGGHSGRLRVRVVCRRDAGYSERITLVSAGDGRGGCDVLRDCAHGGCCSVGIEKYCLVVEMRSMFSAT